MLTADDVEHCRSQLQQRRAALRAALLEHTRAGDTAQAGAAVEVHDLKDEAFAHTLANLANTELGHAREELAAIDAALQRIRSGNYAECAACGRDIGRERLLVQPGADRCLSCQSEAERSPAARAELRS
ncbi:MAG: TraR/DksA family transcriptional regulator [Gammaproteobacteria bacterium]|nr:TraR/DksA family transcriptional regulator [Gammaproteobacteria bacterium]MDE2249942.1 TraR/DksA family transcriptional regulator [Gammaproteobacteria bacterium]